MAQMISAMKDMHRGTAQYPYYGFLKCPICGQNMIRCALPRNNYTFGWTCGGKPSKKGDLRKHRTACPPYYIMDNYIDGAFWEAIKGMKLAELKAIAEGEDEEKAAAAGVLLTLKGMALRKNKKIEYKHLCDTVQWIAFPQWTVMRVEWKCGIVTTTTIEYKKAGDMPYPDITKEDVEHTSREKGTFILNTYVVNGVPLIKGCPDRQVEGIMNARDAILKTIILEPLTHEAPVPRVYGIKSTKNEESKR